MPTRAVAPRARASNRDTAKDILLGLPPSGPPARRPREGVQTPKRPSPPASRPPPSAPLPPPPVQMVQPIVHHPPPQPTPIIVQAPAPVHPSSASRRNEERLAQLQRQVSNLQKQNNQLLNNEQNARRRLEQNQSLLSQRLSSNRGYDGPSQRDIGDLRSSMSGIDNRLAMLMQELNNIRSAVDRHTTDLLHINNEVKSRPQVDPSKIANNAQQLDNRVRDLHSQIMVLKQQLDSEASERNRIERVQADNIAKLQDYIRQQDQSKTDILNNLSRKGDMDKEKLTEEARRLNEKIQLITTEVTRNMNEGQQRLREEMLTRHGTLEQSLRNEMAQRLEFEREVKRVWDERLKAESDQIAALSAAMTAERSKNKERFQKVNEALAALESHLDKGNSGIDKIVSAEIQSRKLHEKGLLAKVNDVEERLNAYLANLTKSVDEVKSGKENVKFPVLDTDALRREMENIAADKNKMSMEGLLKLEEKMSRIQQGLTRDRREVLQQVQSVGPDNDSLNRIRAQMNKLDEIQEDMEKAQERIRDKVERQIPNDLNELSAKVDNFKHQLNSRIDKEEEERYLAIRELQEAYARLHQRGVPQGPAADAAQPVADTAIRRDVDECKIAIKKLAESVTTVKNVLDRKINDEIRKRESDVELLSNRINGTAR